MLDKTWIAAKSIVARLINGVIGLTNLAATILIKYAFEGDIFYYLELMPYKIQSTNLQQFDSSSLHLQRYCAQLV